MVWEAANIPRADEKDTSSRHHHGYDNDDPRNVVRGEQQQDVAKRRMRISETVEAAIARLNKAYSVSISCIGALQKVSNVLAAENKSPTVDQIQQIKQVANAARSTLESAIFMDPSNQPMSEKITRVCKLLNANIV